MLVQEMNHNTNLIRRRVKKDLRSSNNRILPAKEKKTTTSDRHSTTTNERITNQELKSTPSKSTYHERIAFTRITKHIKANYRFTEARSQKLGYVFNRT